MTFPTRRSSDLALSIYALLDKNSKKINRFDYVESTVKLSKKMSHIREIIKYHQNIYLFEANFDVKNNHYYSIVLYPIENLKNDSVVNSSILTATCTYKKIKE